MQRRAASSRDEKKRLQVLDLVESYVRSLVGLKSSKKTILSWIRSFFAFHRRSLPEDKLFHSRDGICRREGETELEGR